jgi:hypothetical protein
MRLEISRYDYFVRVDTRITMGGAAEEEDGVKENKSGDGDTTTGEREGVGCEEGSAAKDGDGARQDGKTGGAGVGRTVEVPKTSG